MNYVNGCFQYWSRQSTVAVKKKIYTRTDTWDFFRKDSLRIILTAVEITIMWLTLTKYFYHKAIDRLYINSLKCLFEKEVNLESISTIRRCDRMFKAYYTC